MSESERELAAPIEALGKISMFCDFRPPTMMLEQVEHLLAAYFKLSTARAAADNALGIKSAAFAERHRTDRNYERAYTLFGC
jgi:hypothetical protein